jgi:hypothetical protein
LEANNTIQQTRLENLNMILKQIQTITKLIPNLVLILTILTSTLSLYTPKVDAAITNGSNAVNLLGQSVNNEGVTPDYSLRDSNGGVDQFTLALGTNRTSDAIDTVGHRLFVVDTSNNRVLVYNLSASNVLLDKTPDFVLGQPDFRSRLSLFI